MAAPTSERQQQQQPQQQHVQFVLLHHDGHLIGATTTTTAADGVVDTTEAEVQVAGSLSESDSTVQCVLSTATGDDVEVISGDIGVGGGDEDDDGGGICHESRTTGTNSAVVIQCVDAADVEEYVECIGVDIDSTDDPVQYETDVHSDCEQETDVVLSCHNNTVKKVLLPNVQRQDDRHLQNRPAVVVMSAKEDQEQEEEEEEEEEEDEDGGDNEKTSSPTDSSVLRTLLQGSRRQLLLYQYNTHRSDRARPIKSARTYSGSAAVRRRLLRSSAGSVDARTVVEDERVPSAVIVVEDDGDGDGDDVESQAAVAQIEASPRTTSCEAPANQLTVSRRIDSQIKALLMGHNYIREDGCGDNTGTSGSGGGGGVVGRGRTSGHDNESPVIRRRTVSVTHGPSIAKKRRTMYIHSSEQDEERLLHPLFTKVLKVIAEFSDLNYSVQYGHRSTFLEVRRRGLYGIPYPGQTPVQVIVSDDGIGQFVSVTGGVMDEVDCEVHGGGISDSLVADRLRPLLYKLSIKSGHVYCPGIEPEFADSVPSSIVLGVCHVAGPPTSKQYRSKNCELWHSLVRDQNNQSNWLALNDGVHKCHECRGLDVDLKAITTRMSSPHPTTMMSNVNRDIVKRESMSAAAAAAATAAGAATAVDVHGQEHEFIYVWDTSEDIET